MRLVKDLITAVLDLDAHRKGSVLSFGRTASFFVWLLHPGIGCLALLPGLCCHLGRAVLSPAFHNGTGPCLRWPRLSKLVTCQHQKVHSLRSLQCGGSGCHRKFITFPLSFHGCSPTFTPLPLLFLETTTESIVAWPRANFSPITLRLGWIWSAFFFPPFIPGASILTDCRMDFVTQEYQYYAVFSVLSLS